MNYRPEVDGLRAVAVLPVMLFHAGFSWFSGGFVGVDVFFVISGYLITGILIKELSEGRYSIINFYERRARRILPALTLIVLLCIPFAWMWMTPTEFKLFTESVGTVAIFLSNFLFLAELGYFASDSEFQPLIHTWSLAIEEQFYVLYPIILWAAYRFGKTRLALWVTGLLCIVSLVLCQILIADYPAKNFFFSPSRFWEILVGSLVALIFMRSGPRANNILAIIGLAMICAAIVFYDELTPFPSYYTLLPVLGTALVLAFGAAGTWVARLLSLAPFVWVGLISYSAYLWHQPLFAFTRLRTLGEPSPGVMMILILLSLGLAYCSWRWIETPFRKKGAGYYPSRRMVFSAFGLIGLAMFAFGVVGSIQKGMPWRLPEHVQALAKSEDDLNPYLPICQTVSGTIAHPVAGCMDYAIGGKTEVLFIGDSHSGAASYEFQNELKARGISSYAVSVAGCIGLPGFFDSRAGGPGRCDEYVRGMLEFGRQNGARAVVITSRFPMYYHSFGFDNGEGGLERRRGWMVDYQSPAVPRTDTSNAARQVRVLAGYREQPKLLSQDLKVILMDPIPEAGWNVPAMLARRAMVGRDDKPLSTSYAAYLERNKEVFAAFDDAERAGAYRVNAAELFCNTPIPGRCINELDGVSLYSDDDHLTNAGARLLAPMVADIVEAALADE